MMNRTLTADVTARDIPRETFDSISSEIESTPRIAAATPYRNCRLRSKAIG